MKVIKLNNDSSNSRPVGSSNNSINTNLYNKVVVEKELHSETEEINPELVYMTIPAEWVCLYHQLINYLADAGKSIIDDCSYACKGDGKHIFNCWALFNSACAAYQQMDYDKANFYYNYVKEQLKLYYKNLDKAIYNGGNYYPITPDGKLKALCSCTGNNVHFTVDLDTGRLYQEYLNNVDNGDVFSIADSGNLNVESDNKV